jgi:hypothetical protein
MISCFGGYDSENKLRLFPQPALNFDVGNEDGSLLSVKATVFWIVICIIGFKF